MAELIPKVLSHWIDGKPYSSTPEPLFSDLNPATGEELCKAPVGSAETVEKAVHSSKLAFKQWKKLSGTERGRYLLKASELLRNRLESLAFIECLDTGKPLAETLECDILSAADCLEYFGGLAGSLKGDYYQVNATSFAYTIREPIGVCLGIGAWNYPLQIAAWKSAPALACGNTMVFKSSELTPVSVLELAKVFKEAGLPDGVFNVVIGDRTTGHLLTSHSGISKVSLTGSVPTGKKVMEIAAQTLKHVTLELGGKSPLIVFEDADLENAVNASIMGNFYTQGEVCSNGTRVFVHKSIFKAFKNLLIEKTKKLKIGNPQEKTTRIGSLISQDHMNKVLGYIEIGKNEGATIVIGGSRLTSPPFDKGCFVEPTVFENCRDDMRIVKEEIFGPVMCLLEFETEQEVIDRANDSIYGLAAGVFTRDMQRGHRVIQELEAGSCWINNYNVALIQYPFGGIKQSGFGRENSHAAIDHYTQLKTVYCELSTKLASL